MPFIVVEKSDKSDIGTRYLIGDRPMLVGRKTAENNPDIGLSDEFVSRRHAEIWFDANNYKIRDLNSTNGTSLDGLRIEPGKPYTLLDNVVIGLGTAIGVAQVLLRFRMSLSTPTTRLVDTIIPQTTQLSWLKLGDKLGEVWIDDRLVKLPKKEYELIVCLQKMAGKVCTREILVSEVWPEVLDSKGVSDASIDQLVHRLRLKIENNPKHPVRLVSQKGFGYMIV